MSIESEKQWHLDKRIPVTLIATLIIQTVAIGIWLGTLQARLNYVENALDRRDSDASRLAVVETTVTSLDRTLQEIKVELRRLGEKIK